MSAVHRAPAGLKLGVALGLVSALAVLPAAHAYWGLLALPLLVATALSARLSLGLLLRGLLLAVPLLLGVTSLALFSPQGFAIAFGLLIKALLSLFTLQILTRTTPISDIVRTLRRIHVPEVLCEAIALLARYSSVLAEEARRMQRARAGRTLRASRFHWWRVLGNSVGLLFVRTVSRAERIQIAMRARGGA